MWGARQKGMRGRSQSKSEKVSRNRQERREKVRKRSGGDVIQNGKIPAQCKGGTKTAGNIFLGRKSEITPKKKRGGKVKRVKGGGEKKKGSRKKRK